MRRFFKSPSSSSTSREKIRVTGSATFCGNSVLGVFRWTRSVCLSGVSIPSISWNVNACTPSFAYCSKQYLTSAAVSSRPLSGGRRSEEHTSELQSRLQHVCRLLLDKKNLSDVGRAAQKDLDITE